MTIRLLAIDPGTGTLSADDSRFHILRVGPVYDPTSGELVLDVTEDLCRDVVQGFEALGGRFTVPFDLDHGLQRGKTVAEKQTYGALTGLEYVEGEGVYATPALNTAGTELLAKNPDTYFISPVVHPSTLFDPDTGDKLSEAWVETLSFTALPRQTRLAPAALSRAGLAADATPMTVLARFDSATEHRQRLEREAKKRLCESGVDTDKGWLYVTDWNDEQVIVEHHINGAEQLLRLPYELRDDGQLLFGEPEAVRRVVTYVTEPATPVAGLSRTGTPPDGDPQMGNKNQPSAPGAGRGASADGGADTITLSRTEHETSTAELARLKADNEALTATELARVQKEQATTRDALLARAVSDGRITEVSVPDWRKDYDEAPAITTRALARIAPRDEQARKLEAETELARALTEGRIVAADQPAWLDDMLKHPEATKRALARIPKNKVAPTGAPKGANAGGEPGERPSKRALARMILDHQKTENCTYDEAEKVVLGRYPTPETKEVTL